MHPPHPGFIEADSCDRSDDIDAVRLDAPTTKNSTPFEFSKSINSRKSLLSRIGIHPFPEFENNPDPFLWSHPHVFFHFVGVGLIETVEETDQFLHLLILSFRNPSRSPLPALPKLANPFVL